MSNFLSTSRAISIDWEIYFKNHVKDETIKLIPNNIDQEFIKTIEKYVIDRELSESWKKYLPHLYWLQRYVDESFKLRQYPKIYIQNYTGGTTLRGTIYDNNHSQYVISRWMTDKPIDNRTIIYPYIEYLASIVNENNFDYFAVKIPDESGSTISIDDIHDICFTNDKTFIIDTKLWYRNIRSKWCIN